MPSAGRALVRPAARRLPAKHPERRSPRPRRRTPRCRPIAVPGAKSVLRLDPGRSTHELPTRDGWYDVEITSDQDEISLRRLVGRVETGRPGSSQP